MPIHASSHPTSSPSSESLYEPRQEQQPRASTSTSEHQPAAENDDAKNVISAFPDLGGLHLADPQEKQAEKDLRDEPTASKPQNLLINPGTYDRGTYDLIVTKKDPSVPPPNLLQTHLGFRPGSEVNKASNGKVHSSGKDATLGSMEIVDKQFGARVSEQVTNVEKNRPETVERLEEKQKNGPLSPTEQKELERAKSPETVARLEEKQRNGKLSKPEKKELKDAKKQVNIFTGNYRMDVNKFHDPKMQATITRLEEKRNSLLSDEEQKQLKDAKQKVNAQYNFVDSKMKETAKAEAKTAAGTVARLEKNGNGLLTQAEQTELANAKKNLDVRGGSGLDEQISTASTGKIREEFKNGGFSDDEVHQLIGRMSMARTGTEQLGWTTEKPGIASHPGGLSKNQNDMRQGITTEHPSRDDARADAVMKQFNADKDKWATASSQEDKDMQVDKARKGTQDQIATLQQSINLLKNKNDKKSKDKVNNLEDQKRQIKEAGESEVDRIQKLPVKQPDGTYARPIKGADGSITMQPMPKGWDPLKGAKQSIDNMAMLGKAYSTQHMMQPAPQLETADLSKMELPKKAKSKKAESKKAEYKGVGYHSRFGQIIGNDKTDPKVKDVKGPGFDQWKRELHNTREREKASAASSLIKNGYGSLVHPDMVNHLKKYGNDPDQALNHKTGLSLGPAKSQANFPDAKEPMTLDEMKAHNSDPSQQPYYLIGPPRDMVHLPDSEPINKVGNENVGSSDKRLRPDDNDEEAGPSKRLKLDEDLMDVD